MSEDGEIKASFCADKTFTIEIGLFKTSGHLEKSDNDYILYSDDTPVGIAYFSGSRLHIDMGSGLLSISDDFVKQN